MILFLCWSFLGSAQDAPRPAIIAGRLLDSITFKPVADVVVVNKNTNKVTLSGSDGYYYIAARKNDSIVFYLIGYFPKYLRFATQEELERQVHVSFLKPNIEELKEIEITAKKMQKENKRPYNQMPADISSPISFLYERYSKKYKQYRKIEALEKAKYKKELEQGRFTREFVMSVTGLESEEAAEFMRMCRFSDEFLETASDYDFIVAIHKKYRYYSEKR
jgi:actin-related protein